MATTIFISYRRDDSAGHAGRVMDRLEQEFGRDYLFMDVDSIPLGTDFVRILREEVAKCTVLLAVIGPRWFDVRDEDGTRRLNNPNDFVRIEIAAALKRNISVIPILLDGAKIPNANQLPDELKGLASRNGLDVRHASFRSDMDRLIRGLKAEEKGRQAQAEIERTAEERREFLARPRDRSRKIYLDPKNYLTELESALGQYDFGEVRAFTDQIDPTSFDLPQIKKALHLIRRKRLFADLEHVASLFRMVGNDDPAIQREWCQSLLDQGRILQALATLNSMSKKYGDDPVEGPEIRGLIGRAYKQLFVAGGDAENLRAAILAYRFDWQRRQGDYRWNGINLVSLLSRAKRDGISVDSDLDSTEIAQQIRDDIEEHGATGIWDYATILEAALAQRDEHAILAAAKKYIQHPDADAFELASTLRQLKEVWRLEGTDIGNKLLPVLEYAVLQREGGSIRPMQLGKVPIGEGFEAVYGSEAMVNVQWIETLYRCCTAIGRISHAATGDPTGTGFLMSGADLCPDWGNEPLFLTNSHVLSLDPVDEAPVHPSRAEVEFTRLNGRPRVRLGELVYSSRRIEMDVSIFRIVAPLDAGKLELCLAPPKISSTSMQRVYVVGHPKGQELAVSLYDNSLAEYSKQYVRYRSPTEAGNSGSPVLDRQLSCFAIHHRAFREQLLNEGIALEAIKRAVAQLKS